MNSSPSVLTEYKRSHIFVAHANVTLRGFTAPPLPAKETASSNRPSEKDPSQVPSKNRSGRVSTQGPCLTMTWREPAEKRAHHASFGSESILWYSKCKAI